MKMRFFRHSGLLIAIAAFGVAVGFSSCKKEPVTPPSLASLEVRYDAEVIQDNSIPQFAIAGGTRTISVQSNRAWTISVPAGVDWVTASPSSGSASSSPATVTIAVGENGGQVRSATVTVKTTEGDKSVTFNVSQAGTAPDVDNMAIAEFRDQYLDAIAASTAKDTNGNPYIELTEEVIFMGTVVSDKEGKNIETYLFALQDGTVAHSGIVINLTNHTANLGDLVIVKSAAGRKAKLYNGLLQVEATEIEVYSGSGEDYAPIVVNSTNIRDYESQLIKIEDVQSQSDAAGQTWSGNNVFINEAGETFTSFVKYSGNTVATFKDVALPTGKGYLLGLSGVFGATVQIQPRNAADGANLTGTRFETPDEPTDGKNIIFREDMGTVNATQTGTLWPTPTEWQNWTRFGAGATNVAYSSATGGSSEVTVRYAASQVSNYEGASGGNNVFFGNLAGDKIFIISGIETFGLDDLKLGFGLNNTSANVTVEWSSDGTTWNNIEFTKNSTAWGYTVVDLDVPTTATVISLRFRTTVNSTVRLDDVTVSTDSDIPDAPASLSVTPTTLDFPSAGDTKTIAITANVPSGYTLDIDKGADTFYTATLEGTTITVVAVENTGAELSGSLKVYMKDAGGAEVTAITKTVAITQSAAPSGDEATYTLLTSGTFTAGEYLIVGIHSGGYYTLGEQKDNNIGALSISSFLSGSTFVDDSEGTLAGQAVTAVADGSNFTLQFAGNQNYYLYAAGGSTGTNNYLRSSATLDAGGNSVWAITVSENGQAVIESTGNAVRRIIRFNNGNTSNLLFSCYASGQQPVYVYKKD